MRVAGKEPIVMICSLCAFLEQKCGSLCDVGWSSPAAFSSVRQTEHWGRDLDWYDSVFEVIDMRSFSNLWYWIALAVLWSSVSHWILGVPHDAILRARRGTPETAMADLHDLTRVNVNRILFIAEVSGTWLALFGSAAVTMLGLSAFAYNVEISQAVFLMVAPMIILAGLTVRTARKIRVRELQGDDLIKQLLRHRFATQLVGVISIFITAMYGMYRNLYTGPFGGF